MPFNGSGTYNPIGTPDFPAVPGTTIRSAQYNNQIQDMATALSLCVTRDGQSVPTTDLPMGGFKLTGLGAPVNPDDSLRQAQLRKGADIPSSATITIPEEGSLFDITGVVGISAINSTFPGRVVLLHFTDALTLINSTNLELPGGVNITTLAGDFAIFLCMDSIKWVCYMYQRKLSLGGLPIIPLADIPTTDIGQISVVTKGTMEWDGAAYAAVGLQPATFAEIDALTEDDGPFICTDQDGILYAWDAGTSKYVAQTADDATALAKSSKTSLLTPAALGFSLQPEATGSATFTKTTNNIEFTSIVGTLSLEVGDVIQISGSADNDNLYTVESIVDADNIIVNYEHRNGAGSLSLADETGVTCTIKRLNKWYSAPLGLGQAWVDVTSIRAQNTTYVNTSGRPISTQVAVLSPGGANYFEIFSGALSLGNGGGGSSTSTYHTDLVSTLVGIGADIKIVSHGTSLSAWLELR